MIKQITRYIKWCEAVRGAVKKNKEKGMTYDWEVILDSLVRKGNLRRGHLSTDLNTVRHVTGYRVEGKGFRRRKEQVQRSWDESRLSGQSGGQCAEGSVWGGKWSAMKYGRRELGPVKVLSPSWGLGALFSDRCQAWGHALTYLLKVHSGCWVESRFTSEEAGAVVPVVGMVTCTSPPRQRICQTLAAFGSRADRISWRLAMSVGQSWVAPRLLANWWAAGTICWHLGEKSFGGRVGNEVFHFTPLNLSCCQDSILSLMKWG